MEQALYNTVISGMSRDGRRFFYVNPLEVWPDACDKNANVHHVKSERQGWFGCACCPPNIARLLASLGRYMYSLQDRIIYSHLYIGSDVSMSWEGGDEVRLVQDSRFPWEGAVRFEITTRKETEFTLALRIPKWCRAEAGLMLSINGEEAAYEGLMIKGYVHIHRRWQSGDVVELLLPMQISRVRGHPLVRETIGKVALQRGPIVYCLEEVDNGANLHQIILDKQAVEEVQFESELLGGVPVITVPAQRVQATDWEGQLYQADSEVQTMPVTARFIPYFAWANRGRNEMSVWVKEES